MRNLRTEDEIIANWKGDIEQPVVSICCTTYNHEDFVEDALEGFLIQETDFPFEILIHDDASSDNTPAIIQEYVAKYPSLIKPIYQTENQYSKGLKMNLTFNFPRAKGEYIALCEGDDFWIASEKLQTQVAIMSEYPGINIIFHPSFKVDGFELKKDEVFSNYSDKRKIFTAEEVIFWGGSFMPTQSLLIKSDALKELPEWFYKFAPVGDYYTQVLASLNAGALYIPNVYSIYRVNISGSWTAGQTIKQNKLAWLEGHFYSLTSLNVMCAIRYKKAIKQVFTGHFISSANADYMRVNERLSLYWRYKSLINSKIVFRMLIRKVLPNSLVSFLKLEKKH